MFCVCVFDEVMETALRDATQGSRSGIIMQALLGTCKLGPRLFLQPFSVVWDFRSPVLL